MAKLPFTSKQDLRDYYPFDLLAVPKSEIVRIQASSGTTGRQIVAGYTRNDLDMWAEGMARQLSAAGADENSIVQVSYGYGLFTGGLGAHGGAEKIGAMVIPTSSGNTERQIRFMVELGSTHLCCTPDVYKRQVKAKTATGYKNAPTTEPSETYRVTAIIIMAAAAIISPTCQSRIDVYKRQLCTILSILNLIV